MNNVQNTPQEYFSENGEIISLNKIYSQLVVDQNNDFDENDEIENINTYIEIIYDKQFLTINSTDLLNDINKLNISFVKLIKYAKENHNYKNVSSLFIHYCDYFNLPYNNCFIKLHEKLQFLIKDGYIKRIGKLNFKKIEKRLDPNKPRTLFDLINK